MRDADNSLLIDKALRLRIDRAAWLELSIQCSRAIASLGVVGKVLELVKDRREGEQLRSLMAIKDVCTDAHLELSKFANLWATLDQQALKDGMLSPEEFETLRKAAHQSPTARLQLSWYFYNNKRDQRASQLPRVPL